jgi:hypothetical protein
MDNLVLGCLPSSLDGTEKIYNIEEEITIPDSYSYEDVLPPVLNQGNEEICVPCTLSAYINWKENLKDGSTDDNGVKIYDIYKSRTNEGEGMSYKDALKFLNKVGVDTNDGIVSIKSYGLVKSEMLLKYALIMNGPCFGALPVYNYDCEFWIKTIKSTFRGYHAIAIVGYNELGFIIRNSWGNSYCRNGYSILPYKDFNRLMEIWTVIE